MKITFSLFVFIITGLFAQHIPSDERGDPNFRRDTNIDANQVRATVFNYGITGRTGHDPNHYSFKV